jgi:hypothetical protein
MILFSSFGGMGRMVRMLYVVREGAPVFVQGARIALVIHVMYAKHSKPEG